VGDKSKRLNQKNDEWIFRRLNPCKRITYIYVYKTTNLSIGIDKNNIQINNFIVNIGPMHNRLHC